MLAAHFVYQGINAVKDPSSLAPDAEPLTDMAVPLAKRVAPAQFTGYIPERADTWVRISGAAQVVGGAALATGIGRRFGATVLSVVQLAHVAAVNPLTGTTTEEKAANRGHFLRNLSLLGATVLASQDTQGKPGLAWRADHTTKQLGLKAEQSRKDISRKAEKARKNLEKKASKAAKKAEKQAKKLA